MLRAGFSQKEIEEELSQRALATGPANVDYAARAADAAKWGQLIDMPKSKQLIETEHKAAKELAKRKHV